MVAISATVFGIIATGISIATQAVTAVIALIVSIFQAYIQYFTFIINITRRDR